MLEPCQGGLLKAHKTWMLVNGFRSLPLEKKLYLFELVADKFECLVDGIGVSGDGNDAFWARSVADIDLGSAL